MNYSRSLIITTALMLGAGLALAQTEKTDPLDQPVSYRGQSLGVGIATYLARQAGLKMQPPLTSELIQTRQFECQDTLRRCLQKLLGDGWELTLEGDTLRVTRTTRTPTPAPISTRYLVLSQGSVVGEGSLPKDFAPTMVVDQVIHKENEGIDLILSPLGPTCLVAQQETVCLRATGLGDSGTITVTLEGVPYTVRYQVTSDDVVLYRVFLDKDAAMPNLARKPFTPPVKTPSTTPAPSKTPPKPTGHPFATLPQGTWECSGPDSCLAKTLSGRYLSLKEYTQIADAERMARAVWAANLPLYIEVRKVGGRLAYYLMTQDSTAGLTLARKAGLAIKHRQFPPAR